jgi:YVTN family beta-propeller protein
VLLASLPLALIVCVVRESAQARPVAFVANQATGAVTEINTGRKSVAATVPLSLAYELQAAKLNPQGTRLYVATANGVSIVDSASGAVVDTIQSTLQTGPCSGNCWGGALDLTPDGAFLYLTTVTPYPDVGYFAVTVIDTTSRQVAAAIPVEARPQGVAIASDGHAYVTTIDAPYLLTVIDTGNRTVVATIPLDLPAWAVAVAPDAQEVYVATVDQRSSYVEVVDTRLQSVTARIPVPATATGLAVTPDGRTVYVATYRAIVAVDVATRRVAATIPAARPEQVAVSHDGAFAYVTDYDAGVLRVVDTSTNTLIDSIPVGPIPATVAVAPDARRVYVLPPWGAAAVWAVDPTSRRVDVLTPGASSIDSIVLSPDARHAYALNTAYSDTLFITDTAAAALVKRIPLDRWDDGARGIPGRVAVSPDGARIYVNTNPIAVIDADEGRIVTSIPFPGGEPPVAIALSPDGTRAYALGSMFVASANGFGSFENVIVVIETESGAILARIVLTATGIPSHISLTPDGRFAYVALRQPPQSEHGPPIPGHVVIVDTATREEVTRFIDAPEEIAISPNGHFAYVATDRATITVIDAIRQTVAGTLQVGFPQRHVAVTPDSAYVYATGDSSDVVIIDTATQTATPVYVGGFPSAIAIGLIEGASCPGDCDQRGLVTVADLVKGVDIMLGKVGVEACQSLDRNADRTITIDDLVAAVNAALDGC